MNVHGYMRASTVMQRDSPEVQRELIKQYCKFKNLAEPLWYLDAATSGKILLREREAGGALWRALRPGDHVVIARLDRAFRRLADCCVTLDEFERRNITLHVANMEGAGCIDLSSAIGRTLIQMLSVFAELERRLIAERTADAVRSRKRKGMAHGRPHLGFKHEFRYRKEDGNTIRYRIEVPDPEERAMMARILAWRKEGWARNQIREKLMMDRIYTRDGKLWDNNRILRAEKAEAALQYLERQQNVNGG